MNGMEGITGSGYSEKKTKKKGRSKKSPSYEKYILTKGWELNKKRRVVKDLYRRVLLFCRSNFPDNKKWRDINKRLEVKALIRSDVIFRYSKKEHNTYTNLEIEDWATNLAGVK